MSRGSDDVIAQPGDIDAPSFWVVSGGLAFLRVANDDQLQMVLRRKKWREPRLTKLANQAAYDAVQDLHRGLQLAMTELMTNNDRAEAELILRQVDQVMSNWLNSTKVPK